TFEPSTTAAPRILSMFVAICGIVKFLCCGGESEDAQVHRGKTRRPGRLGAAASDDRDASGYETSKTEGVGEFTTVGSMLCEHRAVKALAREAEGRVVASFAIELAGSGPHNGAPVRIRAKAKAWIERIIH